VEYCNNAFQKTYSDQVFNIDAATKKIERTWSIIFWGASMTNLYSYKQTITITGLEQATVCVNTFNGEPVKDVELGFTFGKLGIVDVHLLHPFQTQKSNI
jgi:hypothetical protein